MAKVHADMEQVMISAAEDMGRVSAQLADGSITVEAWRDAMREASRHIHTSATALAQGSWDGVSAREWGYAGAKIKSEYKYLEPFAQDIASGKVPVYTIDPETGERIPAGQFMARASMYAESGHGTLEASRRRGEQEAGAQWERRVLDDAENCDDCVEYALMGWQPIGTLPEIGDSACKSNCRCTFEFADGAKPGDDE